MAEESDTRSDAQSLARLLARWSFEGRTFRLVKRRSGACILEVLEGADAMGAERWCLPSKEVNEEIHEDMSGMIGAAIVADLISEAASS